MRVYHLSEKPRSIRHNFRAELEILSNYPDDDESLQQALLLLAHETRRFHGSDGDGYSPTPLTQGIMEKLRKATGQRTTAGLVAIAMIGLSQVGKDVRLKKAAEVVAEFGNSTPGLSHMYWTKKGGWSQRSYPIVGDSKTIERTFRKFRPVAQICAAQVATADYLTHRKPFEKALEADACFLSTVLYFQEQLSKAKNFSDWNAWRIAADPPFEYSDFPPLLPTRELIAGLFGPWESGTQILG